MKKSLIEMIYDNELPKERKEKKKREKSCIKIKRESFFQIVL